MYAYLKENEYYELLSQYVLKLEKQHKIIESQLTEVIKLLQKDIAVYTPIQLDIKLLGATENPSIGIDFFDIDDEEFQEKFCTELSNSIINVIGRGREETIYSILNELHRIGEERPILVALSSESWEYLRETKRENSILIPWFYDSEIIAIPNNTNIFVYAETETCYHSRKLLLRHRKIRTIQNALVRAGADSVYAGELINKTHGLYIPLKRKLIYGNRYQEAPWVNHINDSVMKAALLMGEWEECDGDKGIAEICII